MSGTRILAPARPKGRRNSPFFPYNFGCQEAPIDPPFQIDQDSFADRSLDGAEVVTSFENGADLWNGVGADMVISIGDDDATDLVFVENDGVSAVLMVANSPPGEINALARATLIAEYDDMTGSFYAIECDIRVFSATTDEDGNPWVIPWSTDGTPAVGEFGLDAMFLHELGHCIGFNDQNEYEDSIMFGEVEMGSGSSTLYPVDEAALLFLYGPA